MSHFKGYKKYNGKPISDACGDGDHAACEENLTTCHCTMRGGHTTMHAYANMPLTLCPSCNHEQHSCDDLGCECKNPACVENRAEMEAEDYVLTAAEGVVPSL